MRDRQEQELESFVSDELGRLPDLAVPQELTERVLADISGPRPEKKTISFVQQVLALSLPLKFACLIFVSTVAWAAYALNNVVFRIDATFDAALQPSVGAITDAVGMALSFLSVLETTGRSMVYNPWLLGLTLTAMLAHILFLAFGFYRTARRPVLRRR